MLDVSRSSQVAARFRALLRELVGKAVDEMGTSPFGMMARPFLPMVLPMVDKMSDETALSILAYVEQRIASIRTGDENHG